MYINPWKKSVWKGCIQYVSIYYDIMKKANYGDDKKQNQCYGRDWLWGKLSLATVGRVMLSKSLIQFSADGWDCVPSL